MEHFTYITRTRHSRQELYRYHARPGALQRLIPPWENTSVISSDNSLQPGSLVQLKMHAGKIGFTYTAEHTANIPDNMFVDIQKKGPLSHWEHSHYFYDEDDGSRLHDIIEYALPLHPLLPKGIVKKVNTMLFRMFRHRERQLHHDLDRHALYSTSPMKILISGASGVIGSHLVPFLTTGGHEIYRLVRRTPIPNNNEIFWNPAHNYIDTESIPEIDCVIHLAGEYIGLGRWSKARKKRVMQSRIDGTTLLAKTAAHLSPKPRVFISSSATGFYGHKGNKIITEESGKGQSFLANICSEWENAANRATKAGIRTVILRMGVGLSSRGGALCKLADAPAGIVKSFGSGNQFFSWISMDDLISAILHCMQKPSISGPVNIVSPNPVTNTCMNESAARLLRKPLLPSVPAPVLKILFGQMANELLLASCKAYPAKLLESGFSFSHPSFDDALKCQLGLFDTT